MWKRVISILRSFSKIFREIRKMMPKKIFYILTVLLQLTFFACSQGPNGPMGNWGHMMGYGYGGGFMWLIILALVGVAVYFLLQVSKSKTSDRHIAEQPLDILKKRYAKGEIDKEEFDRKKKDMES
jgi:putative membrane protein